MYSVVSLFAGIGGICLGFKQAGFDVIWANEKDHSACLTYRHNFGSDYLVEGDIRNISEARIPHADMAGRKILCKRFSTKSRMALESRADSGLNPLITESHGGQNGMRAGTA